MAAVRGLLLAYDWAGMCHAGPGMLNQSRTTCRVAGDTIALTEAAVELVTNLALLVWEGLAHYRYIVLAIVVVWLSRLVHKVLNKLYRGATAYGVSYDINQELHADEDVEIEIQGGRIVGRAGVAMRLAMEVKGRFGGTPDLTNDNRLLAARYIQDAMEQHGAIRKSDMARLMFKVRALVFIPCQEEIDELVARQTPAARWYINEYNRLKGWWTSI